VRQGKEVVGGGKIGVGGEGFAAVTLSLGKNHIDTLVLVDFDLVVGAVFDLADDLGLPLGPTVEAADPGDAVIGVVGMGDDAADPGCHWCCVRCS
jgi:hypothetical protein